MAPRVKPIPLRLNPDIEFEAALREQYEARPRARRQEFLRQILRLGWEVWQQGVTQNAASRAPRVAEQPAARISTSTDSAASVAAAPAPAITAVPAVEPVGESSKALRGFFGEVKQ